MAKKEKKQTVEKKELDIKIIAPIGNVTPEIIERKEIVENVLIETEEVVEEIVLKEPEVVIEEIALEVPIEIIEKKPIKKESKPKRDKFQDPYEEKVVKAEKKELSLSAKKWYDYFKLHFNGKDFMEELLNFKKHKSEKFKFINELNEIIEYSK